jgi:hypothetical protein
MEIVYTSQFAGTIYVASRVPREIKGGHSDAAEGHRADPATAGRGRAELQRKAELMVKKNRRVRAEEGSGNVFADLELPHAEQELLKASDAADLQDHQSARSHPGQGWRSLASSSRMSPR